MSKITTLIYTLLLLALLAQPHFIGGHIGFLPRAFAESLITLILLGIGTTTYYFHHRDIRQREGEKEELNKKLLEAFRYIGLTNHLRPLLKNLTTDLLNTPKNHLKDKREIFHHLLTIAVFSVAKKPWGVFRFVDIHSLQMKKEFAFKSHLCANDLPGSRHLATLKKPTDIKDRTVSLTVFPASEKEMPVRGYLILPRMDDASEERKELLQAITDQAHLFFKYVF